MIHCAASVAFDDGYEKSYRANVVGCRNALGFALGVQRTPGSSFIQHVAIETSYIHGRKKASMAAEDALVFPRHLYNNFYELTKAMASVETDRFMIEEGLRVAQLLPSIVIGDSRTGNNRGDTKVVNAPINAFGRAKQALERPADDLVARARALAIAKLATGFPGDPSAELNLVPVDRVAAGILAALGRPQAIGNRIHLATDNRIRSLDMMRVTREELGVNVRLSDPTFYRNLTLPVVTGRAHAARGAEAGGGAREAGHDLRRLQRVGTAGPQRGQRRAHFGPADPQAQHRARLPHALPSQPLRAGIRTAARPRRGWRGASGSGSWRWRASSGARATRRRRSLRRTFARGWPRSWSCRRSARADAQ